MDALNKLSRSRPVLMCGDHPSRNRQCDAGGGQTKVSPAAIDPPALHSPSPVMAELSVREMTAGNNSLPHYWHGFSSQHRPRYGTGADWVLFQVFNIQILEKNVCSLLTWDSSNLDNSPLFWAFLGQCSGQLFAQLVNINFSESHKNLMEIRKWEGIFDHRIKYCLRCFLNL